jgi:hypothetical protein
MGKKLRIQGRLNSYYRLCGSCASNDLGLPCPSQRRSQVATNTETAIAGVVAGINIFAQRHPKFSVRAELGYLISGLVGDPNESVAQNA